MQRILQHFKMFLCGAVLLHHLGITESTTVCFIGNVPNLKIKQYIYSA